MSTGATTISRRDTIVGGVSELANGPASAGGKAGWPLSVHLPLGALPTAAPCARRYAHVIMDEWGLAALADQAELIVSELLTNSVQATTNKDGRPRYGEEVVLQVETRGPEHCAEVIAALRAAGYTLAFA